MLRDNERGESSVILLLFFCGEGGGRYNALLGLLVIQDCGYEDYIDPATKASHSGAVPEYQGL